jgi:hypothetical protein
MGVPAAPNRSRITARVTRSAPSERWPDRAELEIEILESTGVSGPNFAHPGDTASAFTFTAPTAPADLEGRLITASAEYLGGPRGGTFQLSDLEVVPGA